MNLLKIILQLIKRWFPDPNFKGARPAATGGDEIVTPTITLDGEWLDYLTKPYETQYYAFGDALDCVAQSGVHTIEAILNYFYKNNLFPVNSAFKDLLEKGGFLNNQGYIELSVPYIAKLAGTTRQGLRMDAFWTAVNTYGLVPKKFWNKDTAKSWDEYYGEIPADVKAAGLQFAKIFQWNWKVVLNNSWIAPDPTTVKNYLTHSPIHFATSLGNRDTDGVMQYPGVQVYQHAMTLYKLDQYQEVLNQYAPYLTRSSATYPLACAIVVNLVIK